MNIERLLKALPAPPTAGKTRIMQLLSGEKRGRRQIARTAPEVAASRRVSFVDLTPGELRWMGKQQIRSRPFSRFCRPRGKSLMERPSGVCMPVGGARGAAGVKKGRRVKKGGEVPFALFRLMRTATAGVLTGLPSRHFISTWSLGVATC